MTMPSESIRHAAKTLAIAEDIPSLNRCSL